MRQVITIRPSGTMESLQRKPGQGVDLRQFGKADIERASLIEWDTDAQAWYINVLQDAGKGVVTLNSVIDAGRDAFNAYTQSKGRDGLFYKSLHPDPLLFDDYDDAVKVEIAYLDALRLKGEF